MIKTKHGFIENKTFHKREKESMKMRMGGGSWSINLRELQGHDINKIRYKTESNTYIIDYDIAKCSGWIVNLKGEDKLIVPEKLWKKQN
jgi:hypothetical protein|tara:strand:- start:90 stop:356 length:267 start_codon:yes stop_codon:yes gene_type:complete